MTEQKEGRANFKWVEVRPREDGRFDELVFRNIETVHFEMMDENHLWIGVYHNGDKETYHVNVSAKGKLKINHHGGETGTMLGLPNEWLMDYLYPRSQGRSWNDQALPYPHGSGGYCVCCDGSKPPEYPR